MLRRPPHLQALQRDVVHGVVEAVGTPDVPTVVDVEQAADLTLDGEVGGLLVEPITQGEPQVVQGVQLHVRLGHFIIEGDDIPAADVGVGVDAVVSRGRALAVGRAEEIPRHVIDVELLRGDARQSKKLRRGLFAELFNQGRESRVERLVKFHHSLTSMYS